MFSLFKPCVPWRPQVNIEYARTLNKVVFDAGLQMGRTEKDTLLSNGRAPSAAVAPLIPINEDFPRDPPRPVPDKVGNPPANHETLSA